jgi:hypothetical protein
LAETKGYASPESALSSSEDVKLIRQNNARLEMLARCDPQNAAKYRSGKTGPTFTFAGLEQAVASKASIRPLMTKTPVELQPYQSQFWRSTVYPTMSPNVMDCGMNSLTFAAAAAAQTQQCSNAALNATQC